jgi:L-ascorbate metabolism protein UlaG (beta-lactamase superfamily)
VHDTHRGFGGFIIKTPHASLYHSGDSAYFEGFQEIGEKHDIDTALLPIGAYESPSGRDVHMNPEEAIRAFGDLGAKQMIPMHYGHFPLGNEMMNEPLRRLETAAKEEGLEDRIIVPPEGKPVMVG